MGTIAKGTITLSPVNDAYSVSITPASCVIKADFDGSNPDLTNAGGSITVKRGAKEVPFQVISTTTSSSSIIAISIATSAHPVTNFRFRLAKINQAQNSGWIEFQIVVKDGSDYNTSVRFNFSVVRESTMLDWIQDWEGTKTKIGGTYIMTPKLFVGKKEDITAITNSGEVVWQEGALTGVYIGPDLLDGDKNGVGIYGYLRDERIFHLNGDGGFIGGWTFNEGGLQSGNGVINIQAIGHIFAQNPDAIEPYWGLYADGSARFANGNVTFDPDGNASFNGTITSKAGNIGGWYIGQNSLYRNTMLLDGISGFIGMAPIPVPYQGEPDSTTFYNDLKRFGGVAIFYTNSSSYGLEGWETLAYNTSGNPISGRKIFSIGSDNFIAGWRFNSAALWTGSNTPYTSQGGYAPANSITLSPNGIRSEKWYIDRNGTASFVGGKVSLETEKASMFGWLMRDGRFSSKHAALVSGDSCGFFAALDDISEVGIESLTTNVISKGGIYFYANDDGGYLRAVDKTGKTGFFFSTEGSGLIGGWKFQSNIIYAGVLQSSNGFAPSGSMWLGPTIGLIGHKWRFEADGSGAIAGGHITWNANGDVTLDSSVKIEWASVQNGPNLTKIDANGIYTGTINANNITSGTISSARINADELLSNGEKWALKQDGSGFLASKNITWDKEGNLKLSGDLTVSVLRYVNQEARYDGAFNGSFLYISYGGEFELTLPHLPHGEYRLIKYMGALVSRIDGRLIVGLENQNDWIQIGYDMYGNRYKRIETHEQLLNWGFGYFDFIGVGHDDTTTWHVLPLSTIDK